MSDDGRKPLRWFGGYGNQRAADRLSRTLGDALMTRGNVGKRWRFRDENPSTDCGVAKVD